MDYYERAGVLPQDLRDLLPTVSKLSDQGVLVAYWLTHPSNVRVDVEGEVLDVTMSCRVHDSFSQCGRFSARPANFVTEHTRRAKNCVLIHGHNLSASPAHRPHRPGQISPVG